MIKTLVTGALLMPILLMSCFSYAVSNSNTALAFEKTSNCDAVIHPDCGNTPNAFMADNKMLWVVFEQNDHVYFTRSNDLGESFDSPIAVNQQAEKIYTNGENRPKVARGHNGEIYISWTQKTDGMYTGNIRFSRSVDDGKTFSTPITINNDGLLTGHRFDVLQVTESGKIYIAWLDKRDLVAAKEAGDDYSGAALYFAVSDDTGASFVENYKVADNSCECCRIAAAVYGEDKVAVMWRHIFDGGIRDHAFAVLSADGEASYGRATFDNWKINACPHHGPDIIPALSDGSHNKASNYHMVWFSNGSDQKGIYYGLQDTASGSQSQLYSVDAAASASHPQIASDGQRLYIAWKLFDGKKTHIKLIVSNDGGANWVDKGTLLSTADSSDHPLLIESGEQVYITWHTANEGYRVKAI